LENGFDDGLGGTREQHIFTPEWAEAVGVSDDVLATLAKEGRSKVTFEIEPRGETIKLTVVHDGFDPGCTVRKMIGEGWPELLASLKSLLETGEPLPGAPDHATEAG